MDLYSPVFLTEYSSFVSNWMDLFLACIIDHGSLLWTTTDMKVLAFFFDFPPDSSFGLLGVGLGILLYHCMVDGDDA